MSYLGKEETIAPRSPKTPGERSHLPASGPEPDSGDFARFCPPPPLAGMTGRARGNTLGSTLESQSGVRAPRPPLGMGRKPPSLPGPRSEPVPAGPERGRHRRPALPPLAGRAARPPLQRTEPGPPRCGDAGSPGPAWMWTQRLPPGQCRSSRPGPASHRRLGLVPRGGIGTPVRPACFSPCHVPAGNRTPRLWHQCRLSQLHRLPPVHVPSQHTDSLSTTPEGNGSPCGCVSRAVGQVPSQGSPNSPPPPALTRTSSKSFLTPSLCHQSSPQRGSLSPCPQHLSNFARSKLSRSSHSLHRQP